MENLQILNRTPIAMQNIVNSVRLPAAVLVFMYLVVYLMRRLGQ